METLDQPPKVLRIFADGGCYAWDEEGSAADIARHWPDVPELGDIEEELLAWAETEDREWSAKHNTYNWDAFHRRGRVLAIKLARALSAKEIDILYEADTEPLAAFKMI